LFQWARQADPQSPSVQQGCCEMGSVLQNLGQPRPKSFLVGRILRRGIRVFCRSSIELGNSVRVAARRILFSRPSKVFQMPGDIEYVVYQPVFADGTRTSSPTAMLIRSFRSRRNWTKARQMKIADFSHARSKASRPSGPGSRQSLERSYRPEIGEDSTAPKIGIKNFVPS